MWCMLWWKWCVESIEDVSDVWIVFLCQHKYTSLQITSLMKMRPESQSPHPSLLDFYSSFVSAKGRHAELVCACLSDKEPDNYSQFVFCGSGS